MQQYFIDDTLQLNNSFSLKAEDIYHLRKVLRKDNNYVFRVCDSNHNIFLCHLLDNDQIYTTKLLDDDNEIDTDITCILSLIKSDKLEMAIQKAVELGVNRIVLYQSRRSVLKIKDDKKLERYRRIIKEAAEQSLRNRIPELYFVDKINDLKQYMSDDNYICYEKADNIADIDIGNSISYIIGPEGGFELNEYNNICELGFRSISLGKRILRAETAAIYMSSVIVSKCQ